jgi:transposase
MAITKGHAALAVVPLLAHESLYVGIDIGKKQHIAAFVSPTLLRQHERYEACPVLRFENNRVGFLALIERIRSYVPLEQCFVLVEKTGHYHRALEEYLLEMDITVHEMAVMERRREMLKTDKRDAQRLANHLYNQLELHVQVADKKQVVRPALPATGAASELRGLVQHRRELVRESTRRRNKLTAIRDQLFPEFTQVFKDPNGPTALAMRAHFPTPHAVATTTLHDLCARRTGTIPSNAKLALLQTLATRSIGTKDLIQQRALVFEQRQLIAELRLLHEHIAQLEARVQQIVANSREGRILDSIPGIGAESAAILIASIGNILNFPKASDLKAYLGWSPHLIQTGTSVDRASLSPAGTRATRGVLYMVVMKAIQEDCQWARLYQRLIPKKCRYDERKRDYVGKNKVIGRVAGQMIGLIYMLLKTDAELLATIPPGMESPDPMLYDPEIHRAHVAGGYIPAKVRPKPARIVALPHRSAQPAP